MFRSRWWIVPALLFVLSVVGCAEKESEEHAPDPQNKLLRAARMSNALNDEISGIRQEMQKIRAQQLQWNESLNQLEARLNTISQENRVISDSLNAMLAPGVATTAPREKTGWSWSVKFLLVLAIVVICYLVYKRVTRETEEDAQDLQDESFLEENDLGSVRYPGRKQTPDEKNPPPR